MTTKKLVLQKLSENQSASLFLSGEELATFCHVSRAAIWKAIKSLKNEGYKIEAITNRGYRLVDTSDVFDKATILSFFPEDSAPSITFFNTIDSTNTEAKRMCVEFPFLRDSFGNLTKDGMRLHRSVVVSAAQTAGRGRLGRSFYSPEKTGIYLSIILSPKGGIKEPALITANAAVAVCRAIFALYGREAKIKWVNDVFLDGKKICGILTEGVTNFETGLINTAVVGIGINISNGDFPSDIASVAGSITGEKKSTVSRSALASRVILEALKICDDEKTEDDEKILSEYKKLSLLIGKTITVTPVIGNEKTSYLAQVIDIDSDANLIVKNTKGEVLSLRSGEVSLGSNNLEHNIE